MAPTPYELFSNLRPVDETGFSIDMDLRPSANRKPEMRSCPHHFTDSRKEASQKPMEAWILKRCLDEMPQIQTIFTWARQEIGLPAGVAATLYQLDEIVTMVDALPRFLGYRTLHQLHVVPNPVMDAARIAGGIQLATQSLYSTPQGNGRGIASQHIYDHANFTTENNSSFLIGPYSVCPASPALIKDFVHKTITGYYSEPTEPVEILNGLPADRILQTGKQIQILHRLINKIQFDGKSPTKLAVPFVNASVTLLTSLGYNQNQINPSQIGREFLGHMTRPMIRISGNTVL